MLFVLCSNLKAQNLTSSPYSRYGMGELNQPGFAQISALGGTFIGLKPDTSAPLFINAANPAAISGVRLTTLELGGLGLFSNFNNGKTSINNKTANFAYGTIGFPLRQRGAACFGLMPYSNVGYNLQTTETVPNIGDITYQYSGDGGINKAFIGYGVIPFKKNLYRFVRSAKHDSLIRHKETSKYKRIKFFKELLSEFCIGARAEYLFGSMNQTTSALYPGSINYYNTRRVRNVAVQDVTGAFGMQTSFNIDSFGRRELRKKIKITFGYFASIPTLVNVKYNNVIYNYALNGFGEEIHKDTVLYVTDRHNTIKLPFEQGVGFSVRKGDMLTVAGDFAYTNWSTFRFLDAKNDLKNSYRTSVGINFIPNKTAAGNGAYLKRVQYRIGFSYNSGSIELKNTPVTNMAITAGLGLPVGLFRSFAMVNISAQFGQMGTTTNSLIQEKYCRLIIGFTFNDKWFNKFRYD